LSRALSRGSPSGTKRFPVGYIGVGAIGAPFLSWENAMKLLTTAAVIALATATAAFAQTGPLSGMQSGSDMQSGASTAAPTNLNSANQSPAMQHPSTQNQDMHSTKSTPSAAKKAMTPRSAAINSGAMERGSRAASSSQQDQAERAVTEQLNQQQLANANGAHANGMGGGMSQPQTAIRPDNAP
jgi:hypothetical protein